MRYSLHENAPARQQKARANGRKQPFRSGFLILMIGCVYFLRPSYLGQYRIILSADTASEVRQMPSQKRR